LDRIFRIDVNETKQYCRRSIMTFGLPKGRSFNFHRASVLYPSTSLLITSLAVLALAIGSASAQQPEPTPAESSATATPQSESGQTETASPTPSASASPEPQQTPELLPESKTLPEQPAETVLPRDLIPEGAKPVIPGATPNPVSAEQLEKDKVRFRQLRTIAVRDPYAIYFLAKARMQNTDELKREYLRVYYTTMCDEMRKLEPRLKLMIDAFEAARVGLSAPVAQRPTIPGRDLDRFAAWQKQQGKGGTRPTAP
jgi:hypothetical protein